MSIRIRVGAIVLSNDKLLLVEHRKNNKSYWLLPGGGVEHKETLAEAVSRELMEELDLVVEPHELLFVCETISPRGRHILHLYFKGQVKEGQLRVKPDHRLKGAAWFTAGQLAELEIHPNIKNLLIKLLETSKLEGPLYLGNLWR